MALRPGDAFELEVTPGRYVTVRYAGASGDFNPIHIDAEFAREVGLPDKILHGLWIMAQVARAHTEAAGGPETLKRLSVQFRGMGRIGEPIGVSGVVREVNGGIAIVDSSAVQDGSRIIRGGEAEVAAGPGVDPAADPAADPAVDPAADPAADPAPHPAPPAPPEHA